ncbi:MAG: putative transposase [Candidatus Azotimanducaceae bacterium]|jgi:putative transposase
MSSYYYKSVPPNLIDINFITMIKSISHESRNSYGKRRIQAELNGRGHTIGLHKTASLMEKANIVAIRPKKKHYYPNSGKEHKYAPNLLKREFYPETHNTHLVGAITYIATHQGWSYLACVPDRSTKEIVGYALSQSPNAQLAKAALMNAIKRQQPTTNLLMFHSDQGVQYTAFEFRDALTKLSMTASMSRRGNCWDNAVMERFFRSLKTERLNAVIFINHQSVITEVENYIQFYNYKRRHSGIDYMAPHQKLNELKKIA